MSGEDEYQEWETERARSLDARIQDLIDDAREIQWLPEEGRRLAEAVLKARADQLHAEARDAERYHTAVAEACQAYVRKLKWGLQCYIVSGVVSLGLMLVGLLGAMWNLVTDDLSASVPWALAYFTGLALAPISTRIVTWYRTRWEASTEAVRARRP